MELYSKEELLKELKKEYSCGGECDHCPEVLDAGSCAVLRCIRRIIDNALPVKAYTEEQVQEIREDVVKEFKDIIGNATTVSDRYDEGFRDGYAQCINDKEEKKEHNRLFGKVARNEEY